MKSVTIYEHPFMKHIGIISSNAGDYRACLGAIKADETRDRISAIEPNVTHNLNKFPCQLAEPYPGCSASALMPCNFEF